MKRNRGFHIVLSMIGLGALMAYVVACRPSWSPDGSKLLLACWSQQRNQSVITLFDKATGKTSVVFEAPAGCMAWCQWDRKGQNAIVAFVKDLGGPQKLEVHLIPVDSQKPGRKYEIEAVECTPGIPLPEVNGNLLVGGNPLVRLNLETGEVQRRPVEDREEVILVGEGDRIYYCSKIGEEDYEVGTVDPEKLSLEPLAGLPGKEVGEVFPLIAVAKDGSAIAVNSRKEGQSFLLLIRGKELQKPVALQFPQETHELGNLQWSPDQKTVYAALGAKQADEKRARLGVGEISVASGVVRVIPVLEAVGQGNGMDVDAWILDFQIALSPDGKTIAAACTYLKESPDQGDRALYLVDLTSPDRKVKRIPLSAPPIAAP